MNSIELQNYIVENDLIPMVLNDLGCHNIKDFGKEYRSTRPDGDNPSALATNKTNLRIYCYTNNWSGNLYTLCMETLYLNFYQTMKYLHALFGLKYQYEVVPVNTAPDVLHIFTKYRNRTLEADSKSETVDIEVSNYSPYLHINWVREGITERAREVFNIQYDGNRRKIIIPHRHYESGKVIGVMSRTTIPNPELLGIPKYYPIIPHQKGDSSKGLIEMP